jgi:hypothetical protein
MDISKNGAKIIVEEMVPDRFQLAFFKVTKIGFARSFGGELRYLALNLFSSATRTSRAILIRAARTPTGIGNQMNPGSHAISAHPPMVLQTS